MQDEHEVLENLLKAVLKKFRNIADNPFLITDINFFPSDMQLLIDYVYSESLYKNPDIPGIIKNDIYSAGVCTPTELLLNPFNCITRIERKVKKDSSAAMVSEERNLAEILAKTLKEISAIQEEGKENNMLYMEAPVKIYNILEDMNLGREASRKITEMISAIIMEIRAYKIDHSHVFIKLDRIKEEHRSLTREERLSLGLDEILQKQKEIKASTDNLLLRLNGMIKNAGNESNIREKVSQLNYILKNTIEVLPSIDYENIKAHNKLKNNLDRFYEEREHQLINKLHEQDGSLKKRLKSYISLIYDELVWDRNLKKLKIDIDMLKRKPDCFLTRERTRRSLSFADPKFFSSYIDDINPQCRILILQNPGKSYFNSNLGIIVIHNYLIPSDGDHSDIAQAFADALITLNPGILDAFSSHCAKDTSADRLKAVFTAQYIKCFLERFSTTEPDDSGWIQFCNENSRMDFFTTQHFKAGSRQR